LIDTLVTYIPFDRMNDIRRYFIKNADNVKPSVSVVYVDDVHEDSQLNLIKESIPENVEIRTGNWRDKNLCIVNIVKDLKQAGRTALIVDSDNLLDEGFRELDSIMETQRMPFYTVLEHGRKSMALDPKRTRIVGYANMSDGRSVMIRSYRIAGFRRPIFYLGPKQAIRLGHDFLESLNEAVLDRVENSLKRLHKGIGNQLSDEATLGIACYYSGTKETPWVEFCTHLQHQSGTDSAHNYSRILKCMANYELARGMFDRKYPRVYWYYARYKLTQLVWSILGD
jgi:hypothetical protein